MAAWNKTKRNKKHSCIVLLLTCFVVLQGFYQASYAQQSAWSIDLLVQSAQTMNYSSNTFAPFEEINIIAKVLYNMDPRPGIGVSFEIRGPLNYSHPTEIYRTAITNINGIAIISFRLPPSNQSETQVLGEWQVFAAAATFPEPIQTEMRFTVEETNYTLAKGNIELSMKHVSNGTVTNQTSSVFAPFEEAQITANVSYGNTPMAGALVSFEVTGPLNSSNPTVLLRSAIADEEGMATIAFRIPMHNQTERPVLGTWTVFSSTTAFGDGLQGNLTFEVKWPVEISKIQFLDSEGKTQTRLTKDNVTLQLTLNNTDLQPRDVNVTIDFIDYSKNSTVRLEIQNVHLDNETVLEQKLTISSEATYGEATVECNVYSGNYADMQIQVAETKTAIFTILNRDVAVTEARLSATEIYTSDPLTVIMNVTNKGSDTETLTIIVSHDQTLIGNLTTVLAPLTTVELTHTWNTTDVAAGTYEIIVQVVTLPGEIEVGDNQIAAGTVTINYPLINPNVTSMFILLLVITGVFTFTLLLTFVRKKRNTRANTPLTA